VSRNLVLGFGALIVITGVVISIVVFPARYGCSDGAGTFTTSASVAEASCGSTATRFVAESSVVTDQRLVPRGLIAVVVVVAIVVLARLAKRNARRELPDSWRSYG